MTYTKFLNLALGVEFDQKAMRKSCVTKEGFGQGRDDFLGIYTDRDAPYNAPHQVGDHNDHTGH